MTPEQIEKLIQSIQAFSKCPSCNSQYEASQINIVEEAEKTCLLEMRCKKCGSVTAGSVLIHGTKIKPQANTKNQKVKKINKNISKDQVLKFHNFIKKFDGNFKKIFNKQ